MPARTLTALTHPRTALLLTLLALAALAAAVLTPPPPVNAAPPDDLTLTLSLIEDSDNIVPPGGSLQLRATLTSTTATPAPSLQDISGILRVSGDQEWEHNGRSSFPVPERTVEEPPPAVPGAATGTAVDVQERTAAEGGDIVVVGAPNDVVLDADGDPINAAGSVDLFINGQFVKRLTAPTPSANALFGHAVAVGGGYIVVGAPNAYRAYIYDAAGEWLATLSPGSGSNNARLGTSVAIDDAGETIVVGSPRGYDGDETSGAAQVFLKPTGAEWASANSGSAGELTAYVVNREQANMIGEIVAISGDGNVIIIGAYRRDTVGNSGATDDDENGGVLVFEKGGGWTTSDDETPNARLLAQSTRNFLQVGRSVDINYDGSVIVASGHGATSIGTTWKGAAFIWLKGSGAWSDKGDSDAIALTDSDSANGDQFGHSVAISGSGNRVVVSNAWKQANSYQAGEAHIFDKPSGGWAADSAADTVLTSPQSEAQLFFGSAVALDGENTLVVGQAERTEFLATNITTGHGRAYAFDLAAANPQASAAVLDDIPEPPPPPCSSRTLDGTTTWTCSVDLDTTPGQAPMITIPAGTPDGAFTISANFTVDGKENITATLPVKIGTVNEADHAEFDFAQDPGDPEITGDKDEKPYPSAIAAGASTRLQLKILSSVDKPAGADSVSTLLFTTNMGSLNLLKPADAAMGDCDLTCQVDVTKLNASNSGDIVVELTHPGAGKSGTAMVRAQVLPKTGGALLPIDPVTVILSGPAAELTISEPATGVLNVNTATGTNDDAETRDRLRFSVSATDASGNKANVPATPRNTTIKDPDGKAVWRSASNTGDANFDVAWPLTETRTVPNSNTTVTSNLLTADGKLQVELDVDATAAAPLKSGEYTLEVTAGTLTATQTFTVSGGPETITISEPDSDALTIGGRFSLTAALTDAAGAAVPDGTTVKFNLTPTGPLPVLVEVRKQTATTDGQAAVTYEVISAGRASVRVSAGEAGEVRLITTTAPTPAEPPTPLNPADSLSPRMPNEYTTWLGQGTTTASALLDGLGEGFSSILLWHEGKWLRYGIADGQLIPDSINFEVTRGAILWLSNSG